MRRRRRNVDDLVEATLAGDPVPLGELDDPADAEVLRAAIELRAARPAADLPSEEFLARLRRKIDTEATSSDVEGGDLGRRMSRRSLLAGAGAAAAVTGVIGAIAEHTFAGSPGSAGGGGRVAGGPTAPLVPNTGGWVPVAMHADVAPGTPQRFATSKVVGFVTAQRGELVAVSGVCTHMGCLLRANAAAGRLDCPCHRTSFGPDGAVLFSQLETQPAALPKIGVRTRNNAVEVFIPPET
ncbi:MAG: Rieske (2Fe-2S) protein [Actinomycetota bacterium]|nr:Rieske (2Fe-2S) protein [Actinomycetota bacterium]